MTAGGAVPAFAALTPAPAAPGTGEGTRCPVPGTDVPAPAMAMAPVPGTGVQAPADGTGTVVPDPAPAPAPLRRADTGTLLMMSLLDRLAEIAENQRRHRTFFHWIWAGLVSRPETLAEHRDYVKSRAWLEDYMTGWVRDFIEWENVLYGTFVARTVKFACQGADKIFQRQLRFWAAVGIFLIGFTIWHLTH